MKIPRLIVACAAFVALCFSTNSQGQAVYGSINGTVTDNTGAVVPNATITVTDVSKGTAITVKSNESGEYVAEHLIPDIYNVKVEASGFETFEATGVTVQADASPKIDASLKAGSQTQTINVNADTIPELKTDRADVATEFTSSEVENLPIPDRNFANLQLLLPGAQSLSWNHAADENPQASKQIQMDGQAFGGVAYQLDGTDNQDPILGIIVINPPLDSMSETKITTQNFDAEFGKAVASVVSVQTKSGSNNFHGSAFDNRESSANLAPIRSTQFPARPFLPGLKNQFGGSIGGPYPKGQAVLLRRLSGRASEGGNGGHCDRSDGAPRIDLSWPYRLRLQRICAGHPGQRHGPSDLPADVGWIGAVSGQRHSGLAALHAGSGPAETAATLRSEYRRYGCGGEPEWFER